LFESENSEEHRVSGELAQQKRQWVGFAITALHCRLKMACSLWVMSFWMFRNPTTFTVKVLVSSLWLTVSYIPNFRSHLEVVFPSATRGCFMSL
jgi:hypothetical protein